LCVWCDYELLRRDNGQVTWYARCLCLYDPITVDAQESSFPLPKPSIRMLFAPSWDSRGPPNCVIRKKSCRAVRQERAGVRAVITGVLRRRQMSAGPGSMYSRPSDMTQPLPLPQHRMQVARLLPGSAPVRNSSPLRCSRDGGQWCQSFRRRRVSMRRGSTSILSRRSGGRFF
jgi:hypothetical protein